MKKHGQTTHIGELISKTTFGDMMKGNKVGQIIKHSTIFSFWNNIVGAKFANHTKPYSIKFNKLYVSAKSPVIVQELNLYKAKILRNINSYSTPLGIEIEDVIFSYKNFTATTPEALNGVEDKPVQLSKAQIDTSNIDKKIEEDIKKNIDKIKFLNEEQKEVFSNKIITTCKAKNFQEK